MFSDTLHDALESILDQIEPDTSYAIIYDSQSIIHMLTHMRYLIFLSDNTWNNDLTQKEKDNFFELARKYAITEYERRMNDTIEGIARSTTLYQPPN